MEAYLIAIFITVLIYMLLAGGLALQYGFTGLINFGHVGFYAIGAYTSALLSLQGVPLVACILAATLVSGLSAYPLGVIALRLRGDYLAIVTLGFSGVGAHDPAKGRVADARRAWHTGHPAPVRPVCVRRDGGRADPGHFAADQHPGVFGHTQDHRQSVRPHHQGHSATTKWPSWPWARTRPGSRRAP